MLCLHRYHTPYTQICFNYSHVVPASEVLFLLEELGEADNCAVDQQAANDRHHHRCWLDQRTVRQENWERYLSSANILDISLSRFARSTHLPATKIFLFHSFPPTPFPKHVSTPPHPTEKKIITHQFP
jgi:hypothetical protein